MGDSSEQNSANSPTVGVFVTNQCLRRLLKQDIDFRGYFRFWGLAQASLKSDIPLYYFSVSDVDLKRMVILGTYYDPKREKWKQSKFRHPDVLYDRRGGGGGKVYREIADGIRARFDELNVKKINAKNYFDKWETYQQLRTQPEVRRYLPKTKLYTNDHYLTKFLNEYQIVYLKAIRGCRGLQVMRLEKLRENKYKFSYFDDQPVVGTVNNIPDLLKIVHGFFQQKEFIQQKAIDLLTYNNSKVDFRAELQRNGNGELEATAISARVALDKSPITTHSVAYRHDRFILEQLGYSEEEFSVLNSQIHDFLYRMYLTLEKIYGPFGEIGIDFALDNAGNLWYIEANSKSAKVSLFKANDSYILEKAFLNPLEYARYIYLNERGGAI